MTSALVDELEAPGLEVLEALAIPEVLALAEQRSVSQNVSCLREPKAGPHHAAALSYRAPAQAIHYDERFTRLKRHTQLKRHRY